MSDTIGNITVPEIAVSGTFPIVPEYPYGRASRPDVAIHQFGSGNAKIEQRFLLGTGARRFTVRRTWMNDTQRLALRNFWESKYGPLGAFTYNAPNDDGNGTTAITCRFANEPLSWQMVAEWACSVGVTLVEIPAATPAYAVNATLTRFPSGGLPAALLSQVQQIVPLVKIQPLQAGYPGIYLSDRRCTVGGQLYQARMIEFDGISQGMGNESDDASFTFGNADRVMRDLANDVDLYRASLEFSLFHVGTGIKLDLWKGDIVNWQFDSGPEFKITASDGLYELNLTGWRSYTTGISRGPGDASAQSKNDLRFLLVARPGLALSRRLVHRHRRVAVGRGLAGMRSVPSPDRGRRPQRTRAAVAHFACLQMAVGILGRAESLRYCRDPHDRFWNAWRGDAFRIAA